MLSEGVPVGLVVADRPCRALALASAAGVDAELVDRRESGGFGESFDRRGFTLRIVEILRAHGVDLVAMAGFGTVLAEPVHDAYPRRILNTHPALLPSFPGWHAVEDALAAGVEVTGCTVHLAQLEVDSGPVLAQGEVPVRHDDTVETLHERIKEVERRLYPQTVKQVIARLQRGLEPTDALDGEGSLARSVQQGAPR